MLWQLCNEFMRPGLPRRVYDFFHWDIVESAANIPIDGIVKQYGRLFDVRHHRTQFVRSEFRYIPAEQANGPLIWRIKLQQQFQQGGFASAAHTSNGRKGVFIELHGDILQDLFFFIISEVNMIKDYSLIGITAQPAYIV